jgi:hypothetical protein
MDPQTIFSQMPKTIFFPIMPKIIFLPVCQEFTSIRPELLRKHCKPPTLAGSAVLARVSHSRHPDASGRRIEGLTPLWHGSGAGKCERKELFQLPEVDVPVHMVEAFGAQAADEARTARREQWAAALIAAARASNQA